MRGYILPARNKQSSKSENESKRAGERWNDNPLIILLADGEPELMYKMATKLCLSLDEVVEALLAVKG